jgi:F420H(2)-dependent quinone reductase
MSAGLSRVLIGLADRITQWLYRLTGGRLGESQLSYKILLLHSVGRKTGKERTHALLYIRDGENYVVCASNYGAPKHPAWYLNLQDNPRASIQAGRVGREVMAETAGPADRSRLWQALVKVRPQYADYQARTPREIPLVVLKPVDKR